MKKIVILSTKPPYGSSINAEGFRSALGLAFSEFAVDIVLIEDGVYALMKNQSPQEMKMKSLGEVYQNISQFNINLYADKDSVNTRNLSKDELIPAQLLSTDEMKSKIDSADAVITF